MTGAEISALPRTVLDELAPALRRAAHLDPAALARLRSDGRTVTALLRLPFDVLVARSLHVESEPLDRTVAAGELVDWLDGARREPPELRDEQWRAGVPPVRSWRRVETVADGVLRPLVRTGALALKAAGAGAGVADALLDSVVLTASDGAATAEVTLRAVSALTRMGFLKRDGVAHVDVAGRWIRLAGEFGSVYQERPGSGLQLL